MNETENQTQEDSQSQSQIPPVGQRISQQQTFIWGTNISFDEVRVSFEKFFRTFSLPPLSEEQQQQQDEEAQQQQQAPLYPQLLRSAIERQDRAVNVDCSNIHSFSPQLYRSLENYPSQVIPIMDVALNTLLSEIIPANQTRVQVRPFGLLATKAMRLLGPEEIDKLVSVKGMVIRASGIIPSMRSAYFKCSVCGYGEESDVDVHDRVAEPTQCPSPACLSKGAMVLIHNRCTFADKQVVKLQETPETIPEGETPQTVTLFTFDSLVDAAKPGDRVEITGIFRAEPIRHIQAQRTVRALYRTYIDAIHFRKSDKKTITIENQQSNEEQEQQQNQQNNQQEFMTDYDEGDTADSTRQQNEAQLIEISKLPDIYERLTRSLAPSVYEMDDVKKGLLCQLFGGTNKEFASGQRFRGEINILLCGDPGTSKSQLLSAIHKIAPRGVYTSGKGSSAVGLTAYVSKDPDTNDAILESGALVLSDRGVCCIDEFDKMSDFTRAVLHEVMEQQTVSVAKSGVVCSLNARTAVLASANPRESRYNPNLTVVENIQLPPTLLSRFDLIYLILDKPSEAHDKMLGTHIVSLFSDVPPVVQDVIPLDKLTQYISFAKRVCKPKLSDEAKIELVKGYTEMRKLGKRGGGKTITATPRQLESLIRTSEALAKMRLLTEVGRREVVEAIRLVKGAIQAAATDPITGQIDMDTINVGMSAASRDAITKISDAVKTILSEVQSARPWRFVDLLEAIRKNSSIALSRNELEKALMQLKQEATIEMTPTFENIHLSQES